MNVLVTGGTGHLGGHLVRDLLSEGHQVRALVRSHMGSLEGTGVEMVTGDVCDSDSIRKALEGVDAVVHAAGIIDVEGKDVDRMNRVNVEGTETMLELALQLGVKRFIYISSIHALSQEPTEERMVDSRPVVTSSKSHPYDLSKARAQTRVLEYNRPGFETVVLNPTGIIGPIDHGPSRMGQVLAELALGKMPGLVRSGFDWVDARDVSKSVVSALTRAEPGQNYLLSGHWRSFKALAEEVERVAGRKAPFWVVPLWVAYMAVPFAALGSLVTGKPAAFTFGSLHMLRVQCPDIDSSLAASVLGHSPRPFEETIHDTVRWFESTGRLSELETGKA